MSNYPATSSRNTISLGLLALVILLAAVIRLYRCDDPLWIDELHTAWSVSGTVDQIAARAQMGNQSPLFFYLTWLTTRVFGITELTVRSVSLSAGLLIVPLIYAVVRHWTDSLAAALLAALLVAVEPQLIFYAQEARPYACVQLVGLTQIWIFGELIAPRKQPDGSATRSSAALRSGFVIASTLMFYLHYTSVLLLLGELVCWILLTASRKGCWYRWNQLFIDFVVIIVLCFPAAQHLSTVMDRHDNWWQIVEKWPTGAMLRTLDVFVTLPTVVTAAVLAGRGLLRRNPVGTPPRLSHIVLVICWLAVPVTAAWLATWFQMLPLARLRFVTVAFLAPIVWTSFCCASCPTTASRLLGSAIVVVAAVITSPIPAQIRRDGRIIGDRNEDWPSIINTVNGSHDRRHWPVFLMAGLIEDHALRERQDDAFRRYCLFPVTGIYQLADTSRQLIPLPTTHPTPLNERDWLQILEQGGAWLIVRGHDQFVHAVHEDIQLQLRRRGLAHRVTWDETPGPVQLLVIETPSTERYK